MSLSLPYRRRWSSQTLFTTIEIGHLITSIYSPLHDMSIARLTYHMRYMTVISKHERAPIMIIVLMYTSVTLSYYTWIIKVTVVYINTALQYWCCSQHYTVSSGVWIGKSLTKCLESHPLKLQISTPQVSICFERDRRGGEVVRLWIHNALFIYM